MPDEAPTNARIDTRDQVRLTMPADPEFLRLARVTAMGLASRLSFSFDEIEDLRIAIDELAFAVIGSHARRGSILLTYSVLEDGLEVVGTGEFEAGSRSPGLSELSELILNAVTDEHEVALGDNPRFRMVKLRSRA